MKQKDSYVEVIGIEALALLVNAGLVSFVTEDEKIKLAEYWRNK